MKISRIKKCRFCKSNKLESVISLGKQHLQGYFKDNKKKNNRRYNQKFLTELVRCNPQKDKKACGLLQLSISVPSDILYKKYFYRSGVNSTMKNHLYGIAKNIKNIFKNKNKINILDIGCNDGTLLKFFPKKFIKYGVDPSDSFPKKGIKNIRYYKDFFPSKKLPNKIKFDVITSIAMFYDLEDPSLFVNHIYNILKTEGVWIFEVSYMPEMLKLNSYDTICHEHLEYYSLQVIQKIVSINKMKIAKVEFNKSNGGSIRCFITKEENFILGTLKDNIKINEIIKDELKAGLNTSVPYKKFKNRVSKIKIKLKRLIGNLNKRGKSVHVYGASTKGNTILQFCKINNKMIKYASDRNLEKDGLKTLGSNLSIITEDKSRKMKPDYYLALPWHFKDEFIIREKLFLKNGGKFIFPLPTVKIINKLR